MPRFSFPLLDKKEICRYVSELPSLKLSIEDLNAPSADVINPVYDQLASSIYTLNPWEELQPPFAVIQMLGEYPELHAESIGIIRVFRRLQKFMTAAGAEDFSMVDVYRPEPQRTVRFLSAAINFSKYCNQKLVFIAQLNAARDAEREKVVEVAEERAKIQNEIALIEQDRAAQQPQVQALELEIKELNNRLWALNKQHAVLQSDINNLKKEDNSLNEKIANSDFQKMQKEKETVQLRTQIVDNPQAFQRTLQDKKAALAEEEVLLKNALESSRTWNAKVEVVAKADKSLWKLQRMLQSLEEQVNALNTDKTVKERKARLKAIEKEAWSIEAKTVEVNLEVQRLEELAEKNVHQCNAASKDLEDIKAKQEWCRAEQGPSHQVVAEREKQIEALQGQSRDIVRLKVEKKVQLQDSKSKLMEAGLKFSQAVVSRTGLQSQIEPQAVVLISGSQSQVEPMDIERK